MTIIRLINFTAGDQRADQQNDLVNKVQERPVLIYNLAFGVVEEDDEINHVVTSNNADRDKVLATVARSIHDFCDKHGNHFIFTQGKYSCTNPVISDECNAQPGRSKERF